jgi:hypothetical protein
LAYRFRMFDCSSFRQDLLDRDHVPEVQRSIHGCTQLVLLRSVHCPTWIITADVPVGQILATGVAIPLGRLTTDASWRTCLYLQCAPAVINVAFILFICESPRWLYARGRKDEAIAILARYHSASGDVNSPVIRLQVAEIEESISIDGGDRRFWDFRCLFNSPSNRYRFGLCAMVRLLPLRRFGTS